MSHHHAGDHHHGGHHGHHHAPADYGRAFAIGFALNVGFIVVEVVAGTSANSVALLADAGHNVGDVLGLVAAWLAHTLSRRPPTARFTYGFGSSSILAALFNAVLLLVVVGGLSLEAVQRFAHPAPVEAGVVMAVAAAGVVVNGVTALLFFSGRKADLNIAGAYMHMAADALVSLGVVAAGGVILVTGWVWLDPAVSLAVNVVIVLGTWRLLREGLRLGMGGVPAGIDMPAMRAFLLARDGVTDLHDVHVWPTSTTQTAMTAHLVMPAGHPGDGFLRDTAAALKQRFSIGHATLQIEVVGGCSCSLVGVEAAGHAHG